MSKVIRIAETTYQQLEAYAEGFDTPDAVIQKLLGSQAAGRPKRPRQSGRHKERDCTDPGDLVHTKIISGHFSGQVVSNWNDLLRVAHKIAFKELGTFPRLKAKTISNIEKEGEVAPGDKGFRTVDGAPILIQNASAPDAWRGALHLGKELNMPVEVEFEWEKHEQAFKPGGKGSVSWKPTCTITEEV